MQGEHPSAQNLCHRRNADCQARVEDAGGHDSFASGSAFRLEGSRQVDKEVRCRLRVQADGTVDTEFDHDQIGHRVTDGVVEVGRHRPRPIARVATRFADALARANITRIKIPARSPNHNAIVERFQGTMLQECWRPAFHRRHFTSIRQLQREADAWLITYNTRRRNHGNYMAGRRPSELLNKAS
ncbi:MAG: integrase core domain-containing protein [Ilumatobacteraceae bacterium]